MAKPVASSASSRYRSRTGNVRPGIASAPTALLPPAPRACRLGAALSAPRSRPAGLLRAGVCRRACAAAAGSQLA